MLKKIEHKPLTLKSLIDYSVAQFPNCPSVSFVEGNPITYKELGAKIDEIAGLLTLTMRHPKNFSRNFLQIIFR